MVSCLAGARFLVRLYRFSAMPEQLLFISGGHADQTLRNLSVIVY
jgi:hypothetical protein